MEKLEEGRKLIRSDTEREWREYPDSFVLLESAEGGNITVEGEKEKSESEDESEEGKDLEDTVDYFFDWPLALGCPLDIPWLIKLGKCWN